MCPRGQHEFKVRGPFYKGIQNAMSTPPYNNSYRPPQVPPYQGYPQQTQPFNSQHGHPIMPGNYAPQGYPAQGPQPYPPPQQPQKYNASYEHSDGFKTCVAVTVTIAFAVFFFGLRFGLEMLSRG